MTETQVLVVEDEVIVAKHIQSRLKSLGYKPPILAFSGDEALHKADEQPVDLVLMDISLGGDLDGVAAAETFRSRFHIPVIFLTAFADETTVQRAKLTEPYGYILKPFEVRELQIAIEMALYKHRAEQEREQLIAELQQAMMTIKALSGIIPICASCKKIRDEAGDWYPPEVYIRDHTDAEFSHGLCPGCAHTLYPDFFE
jgi:CheY-like chemotaxis protein